MPKPTKKHKFRGLSFLKKKTTTSVPSEEAAGISSSAAFFFSQSLVDYNFMPTITALVNAIFNLPALWKQIMWCQ